MSSHFLDTLWDLEKQDSGLESGIQGDVKTIFRR